MGRLLLLLQGAVRLGELLLQRHEPLHQLDSPELYRTQVAHHIDVLRFAVVPLLLVGPLGLQARGLALKAVGQQGASLLHGVALVAVPVPVVGHLRVVAGHPYQPPLPPRLEHHPVLAVQLLLRLLWSWLLQGLGLTLLLVVAGRYALAAAASAECGPRFDVLRGAELALLAVTLLEASAFLSRLPVHARAPRALHVHHVPRLVGWPAHLLLQVHLLWVAVEERLLWLVLLLHAVVLPPLFELL